MKVRLRHPKAFTRCATYSVLVAGAGNIEPISHCGSSQAMLRRANLPPVFFLGLSPWLCNLLCSNVRPPTGPRCCWSQPPQPGPSIALPQPAVFQVVRMGRAFGLGALDMGTDHTMVSSRCSAGRRYNHPRALLRLRADDAVVSTGGGIVGCRQKAVF